MASTFGNQIKISIFGQSHSAAIGVTVDGLPAGEEIDLDLLQAFLDRRAPGKAAFATTRKEPDRPEFVSGVLEQDGKLITCGAPLTALIRNTNTRSSDYAKLKDSPRPGHADYTAEIRYNGFQDVRGGGHFSGRLTAPLCIAGGICLQILARRGITVGAHIASVGDIADRRFEPVHLTAEELTAPSQKSFPVLDDSAGDAMKARIEECRMDRDSIGGTIEVAAIGLPAGIGSPMFDGVENRLAQVFFGIPAVKGVEFGAGFGASTLRGSQNNDPFYMDGDSVRTKTNNAGGILGGITNSMPVIARLAFKPTPSIFREQETVSLSGGCNTPLTIEGRHDPCIVPRAVPVTEAAMAAVLLDMLLEG